MAPRVMTYFIGILMVFLVTVLYTSVFVLPVRNAFIPYIRYAWRNITTEDLYRIHFKDIQQPSGIYLAVNCAVTRRPTFQRSAMNTSEIKIYPDLTESAEMRRKVAMRGHGQYLPTLNVTEKLDNLYLYLVLSKALETFHVDHFMVSGTLLGIIRHGGFVPWDDDIDLSIKLEDWPTVKQALSCVTGFFLFKESVFHWKFRYADREYPFIDILFYKADEDYVWAATSYIRVSYIYPTRDVFPLSTAEFEGIKVPVPRNSLSITRRVYKFDECRAFPGHIPRNHTLAREFPEAFRVNILNCAELGYMYSMRHLHGS